MFCQSSFFWNGFDIGIWLKRVSAILLSSPRSSIEKNERKKAKNNCRATAFLKDLANTRREIMLCYYTKKRPENKTFVWLILCSFFPCRCRESQSQRHDYILISCWWNVYYLGKLLSQNNGIYSSVIPPPSTFYELCRINISHEKKKRIFRRISKQKQVKSNDTNIKPKRMRVVNTTQKIDHFIRRLL